MGRTRVPPRRAQALLDVILVGWAALWVVAGFAVADHVRGLAEVSGTVAKVERATTTVGETIRTLPLVGGSLAPRCAVADDRAGRGAGHRRSPRRAHAPATLDQPAARR